MDHKSIAEELLKIFSIEDESVIRAIMPQISRVSRYLDVSEKELPAKLREMLEEIEFYYGPERSKAYLEARSEWLRKNRDLIMVAYDIEGNWKSSQSQK